MHIVSDEASKPQTPSQDKEREKHKDKRKKKRKSRGGAPKLRRRSSKADTQRAEQYLTAIFLSYFQTFDQENSGLLPAEIFWKVNQHTQPSTYLLSFIDCHLPRTQLAAHRE